jgi:hypothetical protein
MMKFFSFQWAFIAFFLSLGYSTMAQDTSRLHIFSGIGLIGGLGDFEKSVKPSLGFNSGVEYKLTQRFVGQVSIDFNALRYSQQLVDISSDYLFQNTNTSLFVLGTAIGYNISPLKAKLQGLIYTGGGFLRIGEPRLALSSPKVITQTVLRKSGIFGKAGFRLGFKTNSNFLQTIYIDTSFWRSVVNVQGGKVQGISILLGTHLSL